MPSADSIFFHMVQGAIVIRVTLLRCNIDAATQHARRLLRRAEARWNAAIQRGKRDMVEIKAAGLCHADAVGGEFEGSVPVVID